MKIGANASLLNAADLEWWFRANGAVISYLPATMWLLKCAIVSERNAKRIAVYHSLPLFAMSTISLYFCFTQSFIFRDSTGFIHRGSWYYFGSVIALLIYSIFLIDTISKMRIYSGIRRVELQFLALNAGGATLILLMLNLVGNLFHNRTLTRMGVLLVFAATAVTACALLLHRVFNVWEVFLRFTQRLLLVLILSGGAYGFWRLTSNWLAEPFGLLISIAIFSPLAVWLDRKSRSWFDISGERKLAELRRTAIEITRSEPKAEELVHKFESLLRTKFQTPSTHFLVDNGPEYGEKHAVMRKGRSAFKVLCAYGWATPESLDRRRGTEATNDLKQYLQTNNLGLVLSVPSGSPSPTMLVAFAARTDDRPYTFPEVERLQNLAELIDSILTRSKLTTQAALHARMEYLTMMSRGLAHDLKNLVTPISTFLVHTENAFQPNSVEADVHAAASCAARAMNDYVRNTLSFPDRMAPQLESIKVHQLFDSVRDVMSVPAGQRGVQIANEGSDNETLTCDRVLMQRMLVNLVSNAIDASIEGQKISLRVIDLGFGWTRLEVCDEGFGIPPEHINRVFDPYFTTKNRGQDARGFGLGLTIAHKIVLLHRGRIKVHSRRGQTIVCVDIPAPESTPLSAP